MQLEGPILNSAPTSNTMDSTSETRSDMNMSIIVNKAENRVLIYQTKRTGKGMS